MKDFGYIYILTNDYNTTFYVGVTSDLKRRIFEHRNKICDGFSKKYNLVKFIYFEKYNCIVDAIAREKQIKNFKREWKIDLIKKSNPLMLDLYDWLENDDERVNIKMKIVKEKRFTYESIDCAIAGQTENKQFVRNDGLTTKIVARHSGPDGLQNHTEICANDPESHYREIEHAPTEGNLENPQPVNKSLIIQCPAKINLDLKITSKREDGFHNIQSFMQTISLYDYLTLTTAPSEKFEINLSGTSDEIPYNEKNLVHKAIMLFVETVQPNPHKIDVFIEKNIPVSAGLAGGSTNAAGILKGLNEIFNNPLSRAGLHELCAQLGSDLNFCLEGGRQLTKGRGEILEPLEFEEFSVSLIKPLRLGISAKEAYTKFSEKKSAEETSVQKATMDGTQNGRDELQGHTEFINDAIADQTENQQFVRNDGLTTKIVARHSGRDGLQNHTEICANDPESHYLKNSANNFPCNCRRENFKNDLEWAVIEDYEELQQIKKQYPNSMMSGSGSTYFQIGGDFDEQEGFWVLNNLKAISHGIKIIK